VLQHVFYQTNVNGSKEQRCLQLANQTADFPKLKDIQTAD